MKMQMKARHDPALTSTPRTTTTTAQAPRRREQLKRRNETLRHLYLHLDFYLRPDFRGVFDGET
jgi:hypothetical protein